MRAGIFFINLSSRWSCIFELTRLEPISNLATLPSIFFSWHLAAALLMSLMLVASVVFCFMFPFIRKLVHLPVVPWFNNQHYSMHLFIVDSSKLIVCLCIDFVSDKPLEMVRWWSLGCKFLSCSWASALLCIHLVLHCYLLFYNDIFC